MEEEVAEQREQMLRIASSWSQTDQARAWADPRAAERARQREAQQAQRLGELLTWFSKGPQLSEEDALQALRDGKTWVRTHLTAWAVEWAKERKINRWNALASEKVVMAVSYTHLTLPTIYSV